MLKFNAKNLAETVSRIEKAYRMPKTLRFDYLEKLENFVGTPLYRKAMGRYQTLESWKAKGKQITRQEFGGGNSMYIEMYKP